MKRYTYLATLALLTACEPQTDSFNESNAEALADNMEAQADNLEAMVDAAMGNADVADPPATLATAWAYSEETDKMRGAKNRLASVEATEPIRLDFPYGESSPKLNVRQDAKYGFDIFITANGQFLCRSYQNGTLSIKFDSGPVREWPCSEADGGSSEIVFFNSEQKMLSELKRAKTVIVEAPMYNAGRQQMTFNVKGLKW